MFNSLSPSYFLVNPANSAGTARVQCQQHVFAGVHFMSIYHSTGVSIVRLDSVLKMLNHWFWLTFTDWTYRKHYYDELPLYSGNDLFSGQKLT